MPFGVDQYGRPSSESTYKDAKAGVDATQSTYGTDATPQTRQEAEASGAPTSSYTDPDSTRTALQGMMSGPTQAQGGQASSPLPTASSQAQQIAQQPAAQANFLPQTANSRDGNEILGPAQQALSSPTGQVAPQANLLTQTANSRDGNEVLGPAQQALSSAAPGPGWVNVNGGWVPPDHPLAQQAGASAQAPPPTGPQGQPTTYGGLYAPGTQTQYTWTGSLNQALPTYTPQAAPDLQLPNLPGQAYQAGTLTGYQGANLGQTGDLTRSALENLLRNPYSLSPETVAQMKEVSREGALSMQDQILQQLGQSAASRGALSGGTFSGQEQGVRENTLASILGSNRAVDLEKAARDRQDLMNVLGFSNEYMTGETSRANQSAQARLAVEGEQERLKQIAASQGMDLAKLGLDRSSLLLDQSKFGADEAYKAYSSAADAERFGLQRDVQAEALKQAAAQSGLEGYKADISRLSQSEEMRRLQEALGAQREYWQGQIGIGEGELGVKQGQLAEQIRQFDAEMAQRKEAEAAANARASQAASATRASIYSADKRYENDLEFRKTQLLIDVLDRGIDPTQIPGLITP